MASDEKKWETLTAGQKLSTPVKRYLLNRNTLGFIVPKLALAVTAVPGLLSVAQWFSESSIPNAIPPLLFGVVTVPLYKHIESAMLSRILNNKTVLHHSGCELIYVDTPGNPRLHQLRIRNTPQGALEWTWEAYLEDPGVQPWLQRGVIQDLLMELNEIEHKPIYMLRMQDSKRNFAQLTLLTADEEAGNCTISYGGKNIEIDLSLKKDEPNRPKGDGPEEVELSQPDLVITSKGEQIVPTRQADNAGGPPGPFGTPNETITEVGQLDHAVNPSGRWASKYNPVNTIGGKTADSMLGM